MMSLTTPAYDLGLGRFVSVSGVVLVDFFLFGGRGTVLQKRQSLDFIPPEIGSQFYTVPSLNFVPMLP